MPTIRRLREDRDWTQAELAEKIGANVNTIARWEAGETPVGKRSQFLLASVFGITREELIQFDEAERRPKGRPRKKKDGQQ